MTQETARHVYCPIPILDWLEGRILLAGTVYTVNSLADAVAADGVVTLREAIQAANTDTAVTSDVLAGSSVDTDRIEFDVAALQAQAGAGNPLTIVLGGTQLGITEKLQIVGPGDEVLAVDANHLSRVVYATGAELAISGLTLTGGETSLSGGGICADDHSTVTLTNVTVSECRTSSDGGGAYVDSSSALTMVDGSVTDNWAYGVTSLGGGIYVGNSTLALTNVTVGGNETPGPFGYGGGIFADSGSTLTLANLAVSGNSAGHDGGGIFCATGSTLTLTNATVSGNTAATNGGGIRVASDSTAILTLNNSIVALNSAVSGKDVYNTSGTLSGAYNLIGDGSGQSALVHGSNGNLVGTVATPVDPLFVSKAGTDWTQWNLFLQAGSPAVNAGSNALIPSGIATDLDGDPRIFGSAVDMGAYERDMMANHAPTDIALSNSSVAENMSWTSVGTLSSTDPDAGNTFTYTLVSGTGSTDNASFDISGATLRTAESFNYEVRNSYSIRVRTTDQGGLYMEKAFAISVTNVSELPTLGAIGNPAAINEDAPQQVVNLTGITAGGGESQALQVSATSNNTSLIPNPTVTYTSPDTTGSLTYTPVANASGTAVATVTVRDAGLDGIMGNADDRTAQRIFAINVSAVNDAPTLDAIANPPPITEDAAAQTVNLTGITAGGNESQTLQVTASSSNTAVIPNPTVNYTSPNATGLLRCTPVAGASGTAVITVTVRDAGLDGIMGNGDDATTQRIYTVAVSGEVMPMTMGVATYIDSDSGSLVTVRLKGSGTGELHFPQSGLHRLPLIILSGTTDKSALTITTKGGTVGTSVGGISTQGQPLASIVASTTDLTGDVAIGASTNTKAAVALTFDQITNAAITSQMPVKSLTASEWLDDDAAPDTLAAPSIGTISIKGKKANAKTGTGAIRGDFQAGMALSGVGVPAGKSTLTSAAIAGNLGANLWDITGGMGSLKVTGVAEGFSLHAGDIGSAQAVAWHLGEINAATLGTLKITGLKASPGHAPIPGDFTVRTTLTGSATPGKPTLGTASVAGAWAGDSTITGLVKSITVASLSATVDVIGSVKSFKTGEAMALTPPPGGATGVLSVSGSAIVTAGKQKFNFTNGQLFTATAGF